MKALREFEQLSMTKAVKHHFMARADWSTFLEIAAVGFISHAVFGWTPTPWFWLGWMLVSMIGNHIASAFYCAKAEREAEEALRRPRSVSKWV